MPVLYTYFKINFKNIQSNANRASKTSLECNSVVCQIPKQVIKSEEVSDAGSCLLLGGPLCTC